MKDTYTTTQAAQLCRVSSQVIQRAFDRGDLLGFKIPYSRHRRIPRRNLETWAARHSIPLADRAVPLSDRPDEDLPDGGGSPDAAILGVDAVLFQELDQVAVSLSGRLPGPHPPDGILFAVVGDERTAVGR